MSLLNANIKLRRMIDFGNSRENGRNSSHLVSEFQAVTTMSKLVDSKYNIRTGTKSKAVRGSVSVGSLENTPGFRSLYKDSGL